MWFGFGLVVVGMVLLLNNMGILKGDSWNYVWPIVIIFIGISMMYGKKNGDWYRPRVKKMDEEKEDKKEA